MTRPTPRSFLRRLAGDTRGNTLAIVGAALVPLTGMIGSGVDMSRAYMTKTRLQQACDSGVLATRKAMTEKVIDTASRDLGKDFFDNNFPDGIFGSSSPEFEMTDGTDGEVLGEANVVLPTAVMHLFGHGQFDIAVTCNAILKIENTDVMFVLDTTGSMAGKLTDGTTRIAALRQATKDFFAALEQVKGSSRTRYGFMPYSSNVNVGKLLPKNSLLDSATYQSREHYGWRNRKHNQTRAWCDAKGGGLEWHDQGHNDCYWNTTQKAADADNHSSLWIYKPRIYSVSALINGNSVDIPSREPGTSRTSQWHGCIEERATKGVAEFTIVNGKVQPSGTYDLDIDLAAATPETKWKPAWPEVSHLRYSDDFIHTHIGDSYSLGLAGCPTEAEKLTTWTATDFNNYVDSLNPVGSTYHDIGMIWGARFLSQDGLFASENTEAPNGFSIKRHIVFMTDGIMEPNALMQGLYGNEIVEGRIMGSRYDFNLLSNTGPLTARHNARFSAMCEAAKAKGFTIWTVAFGSPLTQRMKDCATSPTNAFEPTTAKALSDDFKKIANNIAGLRLSK